MKIVIGGESFEFDLDRRPMSEALAIEKAWGRRYAEWEIELTAGSAEAFAVLAWTILRRDGRDVALQDILDGKFDFDYREMYRSINEGIALAAAEEDPTSGAVPPRTVPDGTGTTGKSTSRSSRKSSE